MLICALLINVSIVFCESYALWHIKNKLNILKYYTYLQNFLALITSMIFSIAVLTCIISDTTIPEYVEGLRYIATSGLVATMFIFIVFLGAGKKSKITKDDIYPGCSPQVVNILLHYACPVLSWISFLLFEKDISLSNGIWTSIVSLPSCLYWTVYLILSLTHRWQEPYNFQSNGKKTFLPELVSFVLIPLSFIIISFLLWNIR